MQWWDGWMASRTRWTWAWVNSGRWWWTGRPGVLRFMGSQRVPWATELTELNQRARTSQVVLVVKNPPANAGDTGDMSSVPGLGRSPGGGHGSPLQYSCLENLTNREAWRATIHRAVKSWMWLKRLSVCATKEHSSVQILLYNWNIFFQRHM